MSREDDIKAAEDRAARKLKRLNSTSGGSKGTRTPSPGSALVVAHRSAAALAGPSSASSLVPVGNALQLGAPANQKKPGGAQGGFGGLGGFGSLVAAAVHEQEEGHTDSGWRCPFTKEECLQIWSHDLHATATSSAPDERKVHQLLLKYNGAWEDYQVPFQPFSCLLVLANYLTFVRLLQIPFHSLPSRVPSPECASLFCFVLCVCVFFKLLN